MSRTDKAAGAARRLRLSQPVTTNRITFAAPDAKGSRKCEMLAYTGASVIFGGYRVVIDLDGMNVGGRAKPLLLNHDPEEIAGFTEDVRRTDAGIEIAGTIVASTDAGQQVAALADEGFPWQASVGIDIGAEEFIKPGVSALVNGEEIAGPCVVIRQSTLKESSFVPLGADSETSAAVFADGGSFEWPSEKETPMPTDNKVNDTAVADAQAAGFKDGYSTAKAELSAMLAAFPTDPTFAIKAFNDGKAVNDAKAELADVATAKLAEVSAKLADAEKRLALAAGGQAPVSAVAPSEPAKPAEIPTDPKARAEWEWDNNKPDGFSTKERYVAVRTAELKGHAKFFSGAARK